MILVFQGISVSQFQSVRFEHISLEQGLSQSSVICIIQDSRGFIWFGTRDGLNRWDGYQFRLFKHNPSDTTSISQNRIECLFEDKSNTLWIGTAGGGLNKFDRRTETFGNFLNDPDDTTSISSNFVSAIYEDSCGNLWIGTRGNGLNRFDRENNIFHHYKYRSTSENSLSHNDITAIVEVDSVIWIATDGGGLNKFDPTREIFTHFKADPFLPQGLGNNFITCMYADEHGNLWIGTDGGGIHKFEITAHRFSRVNSQTSLHDQSMDNVLSINADQSGALWIGTNGNGLVHFNPVSHSFEFFRHRPGNPYSLSNDLVSAIYQDESGVIWIGTDGGGLNKLVSRNSFFKIMISEPGNENSLSNNVVTSITQTKNGDLWVGTDNGLNRVKFEDGSIDRFDHKNGLRSDMITALLTGRSGDLWIGTYGGGLYLLHENKGRSATQFKRFYHSPEASQSLSNDRILSLYEDRKGNLWIGTDGGGLNRLINNDPPVFEHFTHQANNLNSINHNDVWSVHESRDGFIWIGTAGGGLSRYDQKTGSFRHFVHYADDPNSISSDRVYYIHEDRQGALWLATDLGLNKFNPKDDSFKKFYADAGLPNNVVYGILEDKQGSLWLSTNGGLSKLNPADLSFTNYLIEDGLSTNEFNTRACYKNLNNNFFFGSIKGLVLFNPGELNLEINKYIPPLMITNFMLFNEIVEITADAPLNAAISETDYLKLAYDENTFSFEFAALDYTAPQKIRYAYQLESFDNSWNYTDASRRFAHYTDLNPGNYTFRIKGTNSAGVWKESEKAITIEILPPWWRTKLAYFLYIISFIALLFGIRTYEIKRWRMKQKLEQNEFETAKLREVDQLKTRFFTNISHELRTPLTLILGPLEKLLQLKHDSQQNPHLKIIHRNTRRLNLLIDQILDLAKIDAAKMKIDKKTVNILAVVKRAALYFESLAVQKNVTLRLEYNCDNSYVQADAAEIEKVFVNLIGNAIKYGADEGTVTVNISRSDQFAKIEVIDTGPGIPAHELEHIFERFSRVDSESTPGSTGTGIGLALAKEIVLLHDGKINAHSTLGEGTQFVVLLPLVEKCKATASGKTPQVLDITLKPEKSVLIRPEKVVTQGRKDIVLVIEDNPDMSQYIKECISANFDILESPNGEAGFEKAIEVIPDLIISDVMMPKLDGLQLCERLKTDQRTSHIPVIMLTAKADERSRLTGLKMGTDEYLSKPFSTKELNARVENLIRQRQRLQRYFQKRFAAQPHEIKEISVDQQFILKAREIIENHIADPDFDVSQFCKEIGMSRMQLHRKLNALTGLSATAFIRKIRLRRAVQLIDQKSGTIAEIAYRVGFNELSYFSKCFKSEFGKSPREYLKE